MSLISMLAALAIGSVVTLTLATMMNNIFRLSARTDAVSAAEQTTRLIETMVNDPILCPNAFRTAANLAVPFTPPASTAAYSSPVDHIALTRQNPDGTITTNFTMVQTSQHISDRLMVASMVVQEAKPNFGRSVVSFQGTSPAVLTYNVYNVNLVVTFSATNNDTGNTVSTKPLEGGTLQTRSIPAIVSVPTSGPNAGTIQYCYINLAQARNATLCNNINGTFTAGANDTCKASFQPITACPAGTCGGVVSPGCANLPIITGFDPLGSGAPVCGCELVCTASPPPAPPVPGPPIPSPTPAKAPVPGPPVPAPSKVPSPASGSPGFGFGT